MRLPCYPDFAPVGFEHRDALTNAFSRVKDGVSEFTFANLYLFRERYHYEISFVTEECVIISGGASGASFFMTPSPLPDISLAAELFSAHDYWKNIPDSLLQAAEEEAFRNAGIQITEDRDNFDYLYLREDLAKLSGKKYHKKRNLVNAFLLAYPSHDQKALDGPLVPAALSVLERWRSDRADDGDYAASREALERREELALEGTVYFVNGHPAGYCLGERIACGTIFALHFEKGIDEYKGIYQYINQNFAESLSADCVYINREQDLGDEGLRQAKMTYRPAGFVKKYRAFLEERG
jgi:hypothetical protein